MSSLLLCSTPVHGHVTPLLAIARHLVDAGHDVRFLTGARWRDRVEASGAVWLPLPEEADYDDADMNASFPGRVGRTGLDGIRWDIRNIFLAPAGAQLTAIDAAHAERPVDAVLAENMFVGASYLLARDRADRPAVLNVGIIPLGTPGPDLAPYGLGLPPKGGVAGRLRNALLRRVSDRAFAGLRADARDLSRAATGGEIDAPFLAWGAAADAIVQFTVPSFEYPREPGNVRFVGPLARTGGDGEVPPWWGDLDGPCPVVHITQGTVANADWSELIAPAIDGLAGEDVLVVVSTGGREIPDRPLPENVRIARYLPYDLLLPKTDVYLTNGGYGGVQLALAYGVPIVGAGRTEDKSEVNARIAWSGVGVDLRTNAPKPSQVRAAVRRVLADTAYRDAASRIAAHIALSPGLDGLDDALEEVLAPVR